MASIEETIVNVEKLYEAVTGQEAPKGDLSYAPIPAEKDPIQHVEEQINRLLAALESGFGPERAASLPAWSPPLSVWETDADLLICVQLPGVKRDEVEVVVKGNVLLVSGQRAAPAEGRLKLVEHPVGPFRRSVILPQGLKQVEPVATMRDGLLEIRLARETKENAGKTVRIN